MINFEASHEQSNPQFSLITYDSKKLKAIQKPIKPIHYIRRYQGNNLQNLQSENYFETALYKTVLMHEKSKNDCLKEVKVNFVS